MIDPRYLEPINITIEEARELLARLLIKNQRAEDALLTQVQQLATMGVHSHRLTEAVQAYARQEMLVAGIRVSLCDIMGFMPAMKYVEALKEETDASAPADPGNERIAS